MIDSLIEELRASGCHGREPWISTINPNLGTCLVALRQLEVCAEQMVAAWLDGDMDDDELCKFIRLSFGPRLQCLANRLDIATFDLDTNPDLDIWPNPYQAVFLKAWDGARR